MSAIMTVLGLMSGTSLDGIDAALIATDGETVASFGPSLTIPYDPAFRERLRGILGGAGPVAEVERDLTEAHAAAIDALIEKAGIVRRHIAAVGFHGHTILHRPDQRRTWQIGDGALLARLTGLPVINDFRSHDVAAGGQGAPLVPVYHQALARGLTTPLAFLNLGGVGNVTYVGRSEGDLLAFDTGPGNALIDDWAMRHLGRPVDLDGALATAGRVDEAALAAFRRHPYFTAPAPKSLDRDDFKSFAASLVEGMSAADGAATLTAFTVASVEAAVRLLPDQPARWLVCGGGRLNPVIMAGLQDVLASPVEPIEQAGWDGDAIEAQAFAFLAARHLRGLAYTYPTTTGVPVPMGGGRRYDP